MQDAKYARYGMGRVKKREKQEEEKEGRRRGRGEGKAMGAGAGELRLGEGSYATKAVRLLLTPLLTNMVLITSVLPPSPSSSAFSPYPLP